MAIDLTETVPEEEQCHGFIGECSNKAETKPNLRNYKLCIPCYNEYKNHYGE